MGKGKIQLRIMIIAQVGSGKTTLTERLIDLSNGIHRQTPSLHDCSITTEASPTNFETMNYCVTIVRNLNHRDFIKCVLKPSIQADCAVLIVSACMDEFENSMSSFGQIREYVLLVYTLGVKQLIVAINKMDADDVCYSEDRFNNIKTEVSNFIVKVGFKPECVAFVPISAIHDDNLFELSNRMPWFTGWILKREGGIITGKTILEALDAVIVPQQPIDKPLRLFVQDIFKIRDIGTVVAGRIETGVLKPNMIVQFSPSNIIAKVQSIQMHHNSLDEARPGDTIGFHVKDVSLKKLHRGFICSDAQHEPAQQAASFNAQIIVFNHPIEIRQGYTPVLYCHAAHIRCRFVELLEKIDRRTNKTIETSPKCIKSGETAIIKIVPLEPICVETYYNYPTLGRFVIRNMRQTVAVGIIKEVEKIKVPLDDMITAHTNQD
ncbi:unnamed protein product [Adineta steineri]|uniref:Elongation factor 1-alpha n=1 Tax=Adineta steineri TaxID=433720 RepID=A0A814JCZ4_9BILA|nr:unnamed protein product [Adineta steineri]